MTASVHHFISSSTGIRYLVFTLGLVLLISSWIVLYGWISIGTEALLVPWHCECTWDTRPALGTLARTINDLFGDLGRDLPSLVFVLVCADIFALRTWRSRNRAWLPLVFFLANLVFVAADLLATAAAWSLSDWVVGPRLGGIDAGYHRTWYGIAANCMLWIVFWVILIKLSLAGREKLANQATAASIS